MGFLGKFTWKEYFLIGGLIIIWSIAGFAAFNALTNNTGNGLITTGWAIFLGLVFTGALLILIAIVDRIF